MTTETLPYLLTFPPMINSEACCWILQHYGVPYRLEPHIFGWHSFLALLRSGSIDTPLLKGKGISVSSPLPMAEFFDKSAPPEKSLFPDDPMQRLQVVADYNRYNWALGFSSAVIGYYYLLPLRDIMFEPLTRGVPKSEATFVKNHYEFFTGQFTRLLSLTPTHLEESLEKTRVLFEETRRRISDGRVYLVGNKFSLADLALASACGPVLLPEGNEAPMPPFDQFPEVLRNIVNEFRQTEVAVFVNRIYREHRKM